MQQSIEGLCCCCIPLQRIGVLHFTLHIHLNHAQLGTLNCEGLQDLVGGAESVASRIKASSDYTPLQLKKLGGRPFCIEGAWQAAPGDTPALLSWRSRAVHGRCQSIML